MRRFPIAPDDLYAQSPGFYELVAGALLGGSIEETARALEEAGAKGALVTSVRIAGILGLVLAGGLLIRMSRVLEDIERTYERQQRGARLASEGPGKSAKEVKEALARWRHQLRLDLDDGNIVVSSFRGAVTSITISLVLFLSAGLLESHIDLVQSLSERIVQAQTILRGILQVLVTLRLILQNL